MPLERSRQLIGGVWRYVSADQSDNGGSLPDLWTQDPDTEAVDTGGSQLTATGTADPDVETGTLTPAPFRIRVYRNIPDVQYGSVAALEIVDADTEDVLWSITQDGTFVLPEGFELPENSVAAVNIVGETITGDKIASGAVGTSELALDSVGAPQIAVPSTDPHVAGIIWKDGGTLRASQG